MAKEQDFFGESKEKIAEYVQDRLLLLKLHLVEKGSKLVATMFSILIIALFAFFALFFLSITLGEFLGEVLHHPFWGYAIVSGVYIILLAILIIFRSKLLHKHIIDLIIGIVFEKPNEDLKEEENEQ